MKKLPSNGGEPAASWLGGFDSCLPWCEAFLVTFSLKVFFVAFFFEAIFVAFFLDAFAELLDWKF